MTRGVDLTEMQRNFVMEYVKNGCQNGKQAALAAGYSEYFANSRIGKDLISKPHINPIIQAVRTQVREMIVQEAVMTFKQKCDALESIIRDAIPLKGRNKRKLYELAIRAINEHNRMTGHHAPMQQRNVNINVDLTKSKLIDAKKVYKEY